MENETAHERVARVIAEHVTAGGRHNYESVLANLKRKCPTEQEVEDFVPVVRALWTALTGKRMPESVWLDLSGRGRQQSH